MTFLPDDYTVPSAANGYMKLKQGENKFRVLSSAILGVEFWTNDNKPVRFRQEEKCEMKPEYKNGPKHFWAFCVWNYQEEQVQVFEITQKTIMNIISGLARNAKWGSPFDYDLVINREGENLETVYTVTPDPKEKLDPEIQKQYDSMTINLEALYDGDDPFANVSEDKKELDDFLEDVSN